MSARVLVTGASGLIGRHLPAALLELGFEVHATARRSPVSLNAVAYHAADLLCPDERRRLIENIRPDLLLHLAWETEYGAFWHKADNLDWLAASLDIVRLLAAYGGRRFVGAGTCAEYDWSYPLADERTTPTRPHTLYGQTKLALYETLMAAREALGIEIAWGRIFMTFGPGEDARRLVPSVIDALSAGEWACCTAGTQLRDFLYAPELARAFAALACSDVGGAVNMVSGRSRSIAEVVGTIGRLTGRPELVRLGALPKRPDDPESLLGSGRRLFEEVCFVPGDDLESALSATIASRRAPDS